MNIFWLRGYEPASIAELCAAMEINPPSLYSAFGNKAQLFLEAARHYKKLYWSPAWDRLGASSDIFDGIASFFQEAANILTLQDAPCGCLIILAATNVSAEGQTVNDALRELREESLDCFLARIRRAIGDGQLSPDTDAPAMAAAFNTMLDGMSLRARDGASRSELEQVGAIAMSMFRGAIPTLSHPTGVQP
jgi:AcrR family transcriptional regulator